MRLTFKLAPVLIVLALMLLVTTASAQKVSESRAPETLRVDAKLRTAAAQHEIISALLQKKDYQKVLAQLKVILDLRLPVEYENAVVEEVVSVSNRLTDAQRYDLAHQAIATTLKALTTNVSKFYLHIQDGRIYLKEGNEDAALEAFNRSKLHKE